MCFANVVLMEKSNGKWCMYIYYTDMNKSCPEVCFPLFQIDQLINSTSRHKLLSFIGAFFYCNQSKLLPKNKTRPPSSPIIGHCDALWPEECWSYLLVNKIFELQIGRSIEVYKDDILVKLPTNHIRNLQEVFASLKKYCMKLDPDNCAFGVTSQKFLGYMITSQEIKANFKKIVAILSMQELTTLRDSISQRKACRPRQITIQVDRMSPSSFHKYRGSRQHKADPFQQKRWKDYLEHWSSSSLPRSQEVSSKSTTANSPKELFLYFTAASETFSSVIIQKDGKSQMPVFYIGRAMRIPNSITRDLRRLHTFWSSQQESWALPSPYNQHTLQHYKLVNND